MRKYRILEEKHEHISYFYPQYRDENVAYYILGKDENGNDIKSEYQYFGSWIKDDFDEVNWERDVFYDIQMARHRIEMDINERKVEEPKEIIIHEYE